MTYRTYSERPLFYPMRTGGRNDAELASTVCTPGMVTPAEMEGPFYVPATPLRRDIRDISQRNPAFVSGRVGDRRCRPIAGAVLDFWQTGDDGAYDLQGYGYRGHQYTDEQGRFELLTVRPQPYTALGSARTAHIHVKLQAADTPLLTTQLYLPDLPEVNARDGAFDRALLMRLKSAQGGAMLAQFDFVLEDA